MFDSKQTLKSQLPYHFAPTPTGKINITNTRGQTLTVSRAEVERQLQRDDLDTHRRRMYEAALTEFEKGSKA